MSENFEEYATDLNCDRFIGKLCRYKQSVRPTGATRRTHPFLLLGRSTLPRDYPVYSVLFSDGSYMECGAFGNEEIEEVKVETP
jgi:hypothetical protein